jgi:hypothetical protein
MTGLAHLADRDAGDGRRVREGATTGAGGVAAGGVRGPARSHLQRLGVTADGQPAA